MSEPDQSLDLVYAAQLADRADEIGLSYFRSARLRVETKPDLTPVTEADRDIENALRAAVARDRPGDGFLGEELGDDRGSSVRWIVDPIDGTRNFTRGIPVWATLIALERDDRLDLGVVSAPALGRRWWAARGTGAFANGEPIHVSGASRIEDAYFSYASPSVFEERGLGRSLDALTLSSWHAQCFSDFWQHALVAEGRLDFALDPDAAPWDYAALQVLVEEAGGTVTDFDGSTPTGDSTILTSNGVLHNLVLGQLSIRP